MTTKTLEESEEAERKWMIEYNYEDECELSNEFEIFETEREMLNRKAELEKENWEILRFGKAKKELQEVWVFVDAEEQKTKTKTNIEFLRRNEETGEGGKEMTTAQDVTLAREKWSKARQAVFDAEDAEADALQKYNEIKRLKDE